MRHVRVPAFTAAAAFDLIPSQSVAHVIWFRLQLIIILVRADPNPEERITFHESAHGAIVLAYPR
jgi:hypothetical protein